MKKLLSAALLAGFLSGCGTTVGVLPEHRTVQEGHGGDGFAASFVHVGYVVLSELRNKHPSVSTDPRSIQAFERLLHGTPVYSTETLAAVSGKSIAWKGVEYARITPAPRGGQPMLMLSRPYFRPLMAPADQVHLVTRLANLVVNAYETLDPAEVHIQTDGVYHYIGFGGDVGGRTINEQARNVLHEIDDSPLANCSGWHWLKQLIASVPVEETDDRLQEWTTGAEVDAIVVRWRAAGWKIYANRARMAQLPEGTPRALLSVHEYLRASEVAAIDRDENYRVSSALYQHAMWAVPRVLPAVLGNPIIAGSIKDDLCRNLKRAYGLPQ